MNRHVHFRFSSAQSKPNRACNGVVNFLNEWKGRRQKDIHDTKLKWWQRKWNLLRVIYLLLRYGLIYCWNKKAGKRRSEQCCRDKAVGCLFPIQSVRRDRRYNKLPIIPWWLLTTAVLRVLNENQQRMWEAEDGNFFPARNKQFRFLREKISSNFIHFSWLCSLGKSSTTWSEAWESFPFLPPLRQIYDKLKANPWIRFSELNEAHWEIVNGIDI